MFRKLTEPEFEKYAEFAYELALDLSHASFPVYTDGIKTKSDFIEQARASFSRRDEEILLFERNGKTEGWIHYYRIDEDKYLGPHSILIKNGYAEALGELLEYWRAKFPGYSWHAYFPEKNREALSFMEKKGLSDPEPETVDVLFFEKYSPEPESENVIKIGPNNFDVFRKIHCKTDGDMYWNCDRIAQHLADWSIFVYAEGGDPLGTIYYNGKGTADLEIFGIDYACGEFDPKITEALLINCLNSAKECGAKSMYFFNDPETHKIAEKLNFDYITTAYYFEGTV
ncbi:MAG: hypothetical protein IJ306_02825 [Oscillospiraceae bacterium]|nr:hypothetical protein [Oscillospiraceae bacterium]